MEPLRELTKILVRHAGPEPLATAKNESLGLNFTAARCTQEPRQTVYQPVFAMVVQGEKKLVLGDKVFYGGAGSFLIVSVDLPVLFQITKASVERPFVGIALRLKPAAIASLLLEAGPSERATDDDTSGMGKGIASEELIEAVLRLARLLDHPRDLPVLGPVIEKEIMWRLLSSDQGQRLRQIGLADSRLSQIGRAMRVMRENYRDALRIEELARISAMSVTSFHRHFRAVALMSPMQYQKQIRLQEARARLLTRAEDIASVGQAVGYDSPSQFSREYKRAYGVPPGEDARVLRATHAR